MFIFPNISFSANTSCQISYLLYRIIYLSNKPCISSVCFTRTFLCLKKPLYILYLDEETLCVIKSEAVVWRCSLEMVLLEISQNSLENTCARVSFLIKKRLWYRCFAVNFTKFLGTPFFTEHFRWLLLQNCYRILSITATVFLFDLLALGCLRLGGV